MPIYQAPRPRAGFIVASKGIARSNPASVSETRAPSDLAFARVGVNNESRLAIQTIEEGSFQPQESGAAFISLTPGADQYGRSRASSLAIQSEAGLLTALGGGQVGERVNESRAPGSLANQSRLVNSPTSGGPQSESGVSSESGVTVFEDTGVEVPVNDPEAFDLDEAVEETFGEDFRDVIDDFLSGGFSFP